MVVRRDGAAGGTIISFSTIATRSSGSIVVLYRLFGPKGHISYRGQFVKMGLLGTLS